MGNHKYTEEMILAEAKKYNSKADFKRGHEQIYRSAIRKKILGKACNHMTNNIRFWDYEKIKEEAKKYSHRFEFQKLNKNAYQAARNRDILNEICSHMDYLHKTPYTFEDLKFIALKYKFRSDFEKQDSGAYSAALRKDIMDDICSHMQQKRRPSWTYEELQKEALKYNTRKEFENGSPAYKSALRKRLLDQICSHMKRSSAESISEKQLFDIIKEKYPKAQKLKDRKVNIPNKSDIKGFDIDIYIPELRKGIEFDGKYWHSTEGLKESRKNWSLEDLQNYHQIKDEYFKSKDIELLHISEEEWLKDRENCIKKSLEFLDMI